MVHLKKKYWMQLKHAQQRQLKLMKENLDEESFRYNHIFFILVHNSSSSLSESFGFRPPSACSGIDLLAS